MQGRLIAFEGIDGTGKSTQIQLLANSLQDAGYRVITTREPTDSVYGQRIRELYTNRGSCSAEEELELFLEDRRLHVQELLAPELERGSIVLTDRYYYSTAAYQGDAERSGGVDAATILARNSFAPRPDLVILLTMDPEVSVRRIQQGRGEELNDFEQVDQLRKVAARFAAFADPCIHRVDAVLPLAQVQALIWQAVQVIRQDR